MYHIKKVSRTVIVALYGFLLFGCVNIQTIRTNPSDLDLELSDNLQYDEVEIYRSIKPDDLSDYYEIGIVILRGDNPKIDAIYEQLRIEAAKQNAHYIIDFKLKINQEYRTELVTTTNADGTSTTSTRIIQILVYTATGTLFGRIK